MSKNYDIPMIKINMSKTTCCKCGKSVDWADINLPHIVTKPYPLCNDCLAAVIEFIEVNEKKNYEPIVDQEDIVNYIHAMSNLDKTVIDIVLNLEMDYLKLKGIAEERSNDNGRSS